MRTTNASLSVEWESLLKAREQYEEAYRLANEIDNSELKESALTELIRIESSLLELYIDSARSIRPSQSEQYTAHRYSLRIESANIVGRSYLTDSTQSREFDPDGNLQFYKKVIEDLGDQVENLTPQLRTLADIVVLVYLKKREPWKAIRAFEETRAFTYTRSQIPWAKLPSLLPKNTCLVPIVATLDGTIALVILNGEIVNEYELDFRISDLHDLAIDWMGAWLDYSVDDRCSKLDDLLGNMSRQFSPLYRDLYNLKANKIVFFTTGELQFIPLHALEVDGIYLNEKFAVGYTPSLQLVLKLPAGDKSLEPIVMANPTNDLPHSCSEALAVADLLGTDNVFWEKQATPSALIEGIARCSVFHFAGHGYYDWTDPSRSGLRLWDSGEVLFTSDDIKDRLRCSPNSLIVLSSCETALTDPADYGGDYVCLAGDFIRSGTSRVIASLWAVNDLATALLMRQFYEEWQLGAVPVVDALQRAQEWLRTRTREQVDEALAELDQLWMPFAQQEDDPVLRNRVIQQYWAIRDARRQLVKMEKHPFAHPYWWAAFQAVGDVL